MTWPRLSRQDGWRKSFAFCQRVEFVGIVLPVFTQIGTFTAFRLRYPSPHRKRHSRSLRGAGKMIPKDSEPADC